MLPKALPDIDLIVEEPASSTIIIAELKWLRKTIRPTEHCDREAEFLNYVTQLKAIEGFVKANPAFLVATGDTAHIIAVQVGEFSQLLL